MSTGATLLLEFVFENLLEFFNFRLDYKLAIRLGAILIKVVLVIIVCFIKRANRTYFSNNWFCPSSRARDAARGKLHDHFD